MNHLIIGINFILSFFITDSDKPSVIRDTTTKTVTLEGNFNSLKGVMNTFSCYCYNGGKLTLADGEIVYICFADDTIKIDCEHIKVKGKYVTRTISLNANNPCPEGERKYFEVHSYICK